MATQTDTPILKKENTLYITRTFDLPLAIVWKAWTEPESFKKWWGPKEYTCPSCTIDLKIGGKYFACMKAKKDGMETWSTGTYKEIIPQQKLVYTDSFADSEGNIVDAEYYKMPPMPVELLVTITLKEEDGKTTMQLTHKGIPEEMKEDCTKGWQSSFDKIESEVK